MKSSPAFLGIIMMTTACSPASPPEDNVPVHGESGYSCDAAKVQNLVGQTASSALAGEAQARSGARTVRWLRPGQMVTMEYRADRLNIEIDAANRVVSVRCG